MKHKFFLSKREGNQFYFQRDKGTCCFSFTVSYLMDGTCVISGELGCLTWKRNCFPKELDYGFPNKDTGIAYFAEKVSQHNIPQIIENNDKRGSLGYTKMFRLLFESLQSVSDIILKEINTRKDNKSN